MIKNRTHRSIVTRFCIVALGLLPATSSVFAASSLSCNIDNRVFQWDIDISWDESRRSCTVHHYPQELKGDWGRLDGISPSCAVGSDSIQLRYNGRYSGYTDNTGQLRKGRGHAAVKIDLGNGLISSMFFIDQLDVSKKDLARFRSLATDLGATGKCKKNGQEWVVARSQQSQTIPIAGAFVGEDDWYFGTIKNDFSSGRGVVTVKAQKSGVICRGNSWLTYTPPHVKAERSKGNLICDGQEGSANLSCDDGRKMRGDYTVESCDTGWGTGQDSQHKPFFFVFGMSKSESIAWLETQTDKSIASEEPQEESDPGYQLIGTGTGFIVSSGYVITAEHVVESCKATSVVFRHQETEAQIVSRDKTNDLALLRFNGGVTQTAALRRSNLRMGEAAINFGYPLRGVLSANPQITAGYISSLAGYENNSASFQYSAPTQYGNSGGPVLDTSGNVIGVVSAKLSDAKTQLVNFATKSTILEGFLEANKVPFEKAALEEILELPDIAEKAETFTVLVGCWE